MDSAVLSHGLPTMAAVGAELLGHTRRRVADLHQSSHRRGQAAASVRTRLLIHPATDVAHRAPMPRRSDGSTGDPS